jgi:hypothetical protein
LLGESDDGRRTVRRRGGGGGSRGGGAVSTDPVFDLTMPAGQGQGQARLVVKDLADRGGVGFTYRVVVKPVTTTFELMFDNDSVAVPLGGTALVPVTVTRSGYNGPIGLDVVGIAPESGVTVLPTTIPAGQTSGVVGLKAAATSKFPPRELQVVGKRDDGPAVAASKTIVFAQQTMATPGFGMAGTIPSYARTLVSLTAATVPPGPILLEPGGSKFALPRAGTIEIPLQVVRPTADKRKYQIAAVSLPPGLSATAPEIGEKDARTTVKIMAAADSPVGTLNIGLIAHAAGRGSARVGRPRAGDVTRKSASPAQSLPPAVAATMIAVEVLPPASDQKAKRQPPGDAKRVAAGR